MIRVFQIAVPFVWAGLLTGISFIEAPLKFKAPGITLALGVGIGRLVFSTLNKVELFLMLILVVNYFFSYPDKKVLFAFIPIAFLLLLQIFWLLPILHQYALQAIESKPLPKSYTHFIYVVFEIVKLILLIVLGSFSSK